MKKPHGNSTKCVETVTYSLYKRYNSFIVSIKDERLDNDSAKLYDDIINEFCTSGNGALFNFHYPIYKDLKWLKFCFLECEMPKNGFYRSLVDSESCLRMLFNDTKYHEVEDLVYYDLDFFQLEKVGKNPSVLSAYAERIKSFKDSLFFV